MTVRRTENSDAGQTKRAAYQGNVPADRARDRGHRGRLAALLAVLLPFRSHLSTAIPALLFVLPALVGVVVGGFVPGVVGALGGFLFYDYLFLPPYNTLTVRSPQNWVALAVYLAVVLVVVASGGPAAEGPRGRANAGPRRPDDSPSCPRP